MDKLDFVDTHVHFYDMQHPELFYAHWQPDVDPPLIGTQMRKLGEQNFLAEDYIASALSFSISCHCTFILALRLYFSNSAKPR